MIQVWPKSWESSELVNQGKIIRHPLHRVFAGRPGASARIVVKKRFPALGEPVIPANHQSMQQSRGINPPAES
ncbi:MAG: hypothetical protein DRI57_06910 [Deltaproteobacteria bacterium]|nr:MAG: hypothetical protein DRI57_06910 [Deltaproteobacteria bacterium]